MILQLLLLSAHMSEATQTGEEIKDLNFTGNWTTCDEFLDVAFDEKSVVDIDWRVFYMWNMLFEQPYQVRFREPTQSLIEKFKNEIDLNVRATVNWNDTAFFMESTIDLSALFIRTNTSGMYKVISSLIFQYDVDPDVIFAMKLVKPGYLGYMNCKLQVVVAFAPVDKMPDDNKLEEAAQLFNMNNPFGFSHNAENPMRNYPFKVLENNDDADDEEEMEVEMHGNSLLE